MEKKPDIPVWTFILFIRRYNNISGKFALQLNESTDISGHAQLLALCRRQHQRNFSVLQATARKHNIRGNILSCIRLSVDCGGFDEPVLRKQPHGSLIQCCKYDQYDIFRTTLWSMTCLMTGICVCCCFEVLYLYR